MGCHRLAPGLPPGSLWPASWAASSFKTKRGNTTKTHDFCLRSLCLPLLASACLRMAPGLPPARPWPASGLPLACFLGSLKLQAFKCKATESKRQKKGRRCTPQASSIRRADLGRIRRFRQGKALCLRIERLCSLEIRFIESLAANQTTDLHTYNFLTGFTASAAKHKKKRR